MVYSLTETEAPLLDTLITTLKPGDCYYTTSPDFYRQIISFEKDYILVRRYDGWYNRIFDLDKLVIKL